MSEQKAKTGEVPEEAGTPLAPDLEAALRDAEAHAEDIEANKVKEVQGENATADSASQELASLRAELEKAEKTTNDMREGMLRARADLENARRRFEREQKESQLYAGERVLKSLIPIVDDLDRTLENIPDDLGEDHSLVAGVNMVHRKFLQALESQGAKSFHPLGETFDPTNHEALMEAPSTEYEAGKIMQVFQRGWLLNERLLRPAKVIIAKSAT